MSKNNENKLIPKLRFPEFKNEDAWKVDEVGNVFDVTRGYVLSMNLVSEEQNESNPFPVYSSQTKNNGLAGYYKEFLYEDAITWTTDGANAGDVNFRKGKFYCTNVCGVLINKNGFANLCIASLINSVSRRHVSYVGNPKLMNGVMSKIKIPFPEVKEQHHIASCLSSLDEVITAESQKLEVLKDHKKGLLQNLFPKEGETVPKLRFAEFANYNEWELKTITSIGNVITGNTPSKADEKNWEGDFVWITAQDFKNKYIETSTLKLTEQGKNKSRVVPKNSILVTCIASIGLNGINKVECATNQQINAVVVKSGYDNEFIYYAISYNTNRLKNLAGQTAVPIISKGVFENFTIQIPSLLKEQQKIASCLSSLDDLITKQTEKIEQLKLHKKGLLQGLFPTMNEILRG